ncbi:MAG: TrkA C-terminal domain-containing protein [Clostridia bacterium]|nr:TrkA C-terminal domain-containing protein [Clostridia bacterium]
MNLILFGVILAIIWVIIEIVSILFKSTGMDLYKARFQTISILTHTGFTTRESELIVQHPLRRKFASFLMVISYLSQITLISVLLNILISNSNKLLSIGTVVLAVLLFFILVTRTKFLSSRIDRVMERIIEKRILRSTKKNPMSRVLKTDQEFGIYEIVVDENGGLDGKALKDSGLKEDFIQVLKIEKGHESINFPEPGQMIDAGDKLIVYGKIKSIKDMSINR